jgi:hypothetical protein
LLRKPDRKIPLGKSKGRWEDIKMDNKIQDARVQTG